MLKGMLKKLKDENEELKDELKLRLEGVKDLRSQIRNIENNLKASKLEIAQFDSIEHKFNEDEAQKLNFTGAKHDAYEAAFYNTITQKYFCPLRDFKMNRRGNKADIPVDVEFEGLTITFYVRFKDSFRDLSEQASSYWAIPASEIYFSDKPASSTQEVFLTSMKVSNELYVWQNTKLRQKNFLLYLVLSNYSELSEKVNQVFTKENEDETKIFIEDLSVITSRTFDKIPNSTNKISKKSSAIASKRFWLRFQYFAQWGLYTALFLTWVFTLSTNYDVNNKSWINKCISRTLLWNFRFSDESTRTIFGPSVESDFFLVTNTEKLWQYIFNIQEKLTSDNEQGLLANNIYTLQYMEVRQLRTKVTQCENEFNYSCTGSYFHNSNRDEKKLGPYWYQDYKIRQSSVFIYGELGFYPNSGYLNSVNLQDESDYNQNLTDLKASGWIDEGTRAVFITINFYNPESDILTIAMPYFEINPSGFIIHNFKIYSIKKNLLEGSQIVANLFIFIISVILLCLDIRQNIRHPQEKKAFVYGCLEIELELLYDEIVNYEKENLFMKLKKPTKDELFSHFTLTCVIVLEIIGLSFYLGLYKQATEISLGYTDLFGALQGVSMLNDANTIVTIFIAVNVTRFILIWFSMICKYSQVVLNVMIQYSFTILCSVVPILIFSVFFQFFLGHIEESFSNYSKSFISTIRLFCGNWPVSTNFLYFVNSDILVLILLCFSAMKYFLVTFQIAYIQSEFWKLGINNK